jgi:hypothetical protein
MKKFNVIAMGFILVAAMFGCGKKSGLEGKVVDGKGKPMAGVKVVAKQVQPIKGYEQFESTTSSDGGFKFGKLFPTSTYELIAYSDGTIKNMSIKIESGPEGQTKILPNPLLIRFKFSKDGTTALDTITGLMWTKNADIAGRAMGWGEAMEWARRLDIGGYRDWRLPTKGEFLISDETIEFNNVRGPYWSSNDEGSNSNIASYVNMDDGKEGQGYKTGNWNNSYHVWPVRSTQ